MSADQSFTMRIWTKNLASLAAGLLALGWAAKSARAATWPGAQPPASAAPSALTHYETNGFFVAVKDFPLRMVFLGDPPDYLDAEVVEYALGRALAEWNRVPCSAARLEYGGRRAAIDALAPDEVPVLFADPGAEPCFPEGHIGWTALSCGAKFPDKTIFLNRRDYQWAQHPAPFQRIDQGEDAPLIVDLEGVLTHEIGHALGLAHSEDPLATMAPTYRQDGAQAQLAVDDKIGVCELYPAKNPPDECRAGRDCRPQERCEDVTLAGGEALRLCRELRGAPGDACALDRLVCEDACALAEDPARFGYCTTRCDPDAAPDAAAGCPTGFSCAPDLLAPGAAHCEWVDGPDALLSGCSVGKKTPAAPPFWAWLAGLLWLKSRQKQRPAPQLNPP